MQGLSCSVPYSPNDLTYHSLPWVLVRVLKVNVRFVSGVCFIQLHDKLHDLPQSAPQG